MLSHLFISYSVLLLVIGDVIGNNGEIDLELYEDVNIIYPEFLELSGRRKRENSETIGLNAVKLDKWLVQLNEEVDMIIPSDFEVEWIASDGSVSRATLENCSFHQGRILGGRVNNETAAALTICNREIMGVISTAGILYFVEPLNDTSGAHLMYKSKKIQNKIKRSVLQNYTEKVANPWIYNLTGDIIDIGGDDTENSREFEFEQDMNDSTPNGNPNYESVSVTRGNNTEEFPTLLSNQENWHHERIDIGEEDNGYFFDSTWSTSIMQVRKSTGSMMPARWLEIAIAVDYTLISFHGRNKVERYVLSLMNIVSAIYQDPSLNANTKLIITRLIMYEHKKHSVIRQGNARRSLENVNTWNKRLHAALPPGKSPHDIAIWLTRLDIGGPSGYAPVSGTCDPKRSCALTRDEGLTSAFIIAHETAHILGLSHDGDKKNHNHCAQEALDGSIMAPMVSATFNKFMWSPCSKEEFQKSMNKWTCLLNAPRDPGDITLDATLQTAFTMDEQCRMEFGDGYSMCRSFEIVEPCSHLWCGHEDSPLVCKTKKGPPLEGTECDFGKWCVNGYCQKVGNTRIGRVPVIFNSLDGGWSEWGPWGPCSRPCGSGIQFRSRICNNPEPAHGGKFCSGDSEEWQICFVKECLDPSIDLRAQQCKLLPKLLNLEIPEQNSTWVPHESDLNDRKCKLICIHDDRKELYSTNENLMDGTPCSYDNEDNICVQGKCYVVGCDHKLHSDIRRDRCGVCEGNNSTCVDVNSQKSRKLKREITRIALLPKMARHIRVEIKAYLNSTQSPNLAVILRNRRRKKYLITIPTTSVHKKIMEGTKFSYRKRNDKHVIWASGPLYAETVLLLVASKNDVQSGLTIHSTTKFSIQRDYLKPSKRFVWILGGWGPCSVSCGGGRRQKTAACWDVLEDKLVKKNHCSLLQKPKLSSEKCNTFGCNFQWVPGEWEPCSASCGRHGIQSRELYCIPDSLANGIYDDNGNMTVTPWTFMVNPKRCSGPQPITTQACNRVPCFSYWTSGNWSQCSSQCGLGKQTRLVKCLPPEEQDFFSCGNMPPASERRCRGNRDQIYCKQKRPKCRKDRSEFCSFSLLHKYCELKGFRQICCKSCESIYSHFAMFSSNI